MKPTQGIYKEAKTRLIKEIQKGTVSLGMGGAVAKRLNLAPRTVRTLGAGKEGVADLILHSKTPRGVAVAKTYDLTSPHVSVGQIRAKTKFLSQVSKEPGSVFPKLLATHRTKPITYHEYIPSLSGLPAKTTREKAIAQASSKGVRIGDLHSGNIRSGRVVDFTVAAPGATTRAQSIGNRRQRVLNIANTSRGTKKEEKARGVMLSLNKQHDETLAFNVNKQELMKRVHA